jgi:hypothetical protein
VGKKGGKPSVRVRRASETNEAVERILASTARLWHEIRPANIPHAQDNVRRLRRGEPAWWPSDMHARFGQHMLALQDHIARHAVVDLWRQQGRVAYDLHPEMAAQLYRADLKGRLPGGLFRRLPHISPMVPLPRPWPFVSNTGVKGLIRAYFLTGSVGQSFCPTTDPRSEGLVVMPWIEWDHAVDGEYEAVATPLFALPNTDKPFTLDDVIDSTNTWAGVTDAAGEKELVRPLVKQILPGFMSVLTYLCCDNRDVVEPQPVKARRGPRMQAAPPREPFYVRVGWHIGPKLHDQRMLAQGGGRGAVAVPSGVEYGPQHRAGHYKRVHHGPRRSLESVRWVDPYWTKRELLEEGQEPGTAVIPVDRQRRDPANHRDVKLVNLGRTKAEEIKARQQAREDEWEF